MGSVLVFIHVAGVVVWVGGMFMMLVCVQPGAVAQLAPPVRLPLMAAVLQRFLAAVWVAMPLVLVTGAIRLANTGMAQAPPGWHIMALLGCVMAVVFVVIWRGPWQTMRVAVAAQQWPQAGAAAARLRSLVLVNLVLGFLTIAAATIGLSL